MYQTIGNTLAISVSDWCQAGLTQDQFENDSRRGYLSIYRRGIKGNTLIDVKSIRRPDRLNAIEAKFGKIETEGPKSIFRIEDDDKARTYFMNKEKPDGSALDKDKVEEYVNRAKIFNALKSGLESEIAARAKGGKRVELGKFWNLAVQWQLEQVEHHRCTPIGNPKALKRAFNEYLKGGYETIIHKGLGNDRARKVSTSMEKLLLALWRTNDKPYVTRVHELYLEFVSGRKELFDKKTGEVFIPVDFCYKGRAMEISVATVWNYLKSVVNSTAVYADRNGNFDYANSQRPKQHRKPGKYSLSKISMDDVAMSRKSVRGWVYKYISVDVVSGYWFRPAYIVGKPNANTVIEAFRNMFCELAEYGLPMPGELEVEYHLMKDFDWLKEVFPFTRFCESPTEKRAEHNIKALKYGVSKKEGHMRGRWYAKHEAYRCVRNKVSGDFIEPEFQPQTIVADDLSDIEIHNNSLHPLQKTYPGLTRKQVFLANINPNLLPVENWRLYKFIGNETTTSIYNNDYCPVQNETFELMNFSNLKRLKPNNREVTAYWMPEQDGSINTVYLYQGETYIGEAVNRAQFAYNECAIERTEEDDANMLHQHKRGSHFDKFMREERADIPKIGYMNAETSNDIASVFESDIIVEQVQEDIQDNVVEVATNDWVAFARAQL